MRVNKVFNKVLSILMTLLMLISSIPLDTGLLNFKDSNIEVAYASGAYVGGQTGNITSRVAQRGSGGGIDRPTFHNPGMRVGIYRNSETSQYKYTPDEVIKNMMVGAPLKDSIVSPLYVYSDTRVVGTDVYPAIQYLVIGTSGGDGVLIGSNPDRVKFRSASIRTNTVGTNGVYYDSIKVAKENGTLASTWKTIADSQVTKSTQAWSYIFDLMSPDNKTMDQKIIEIFKLVHLNDGKELSAEQEEEFWIRYMDVLMSLYAFADGTPSKNLWGVAIDDYITGNNLAENPVNIIFEPATIVKSLQQGHIAITWLDYLNYYTGVNAGRAIDSLAWHSGTQKDDVKEKGIYTQLFKSIEQSIISNPALYRISKGYVESNPWSFGATAITRYRLNTGTGKPVWAASPTAGVAHAVAEIAWIGDNKGRLKTHWGMMILLMPEAAPVLPLGKLEATPDEQPVETKTLGMPVTLNIFSGADKNEIAAWESIIADATKANSNFKLKVTDMKRTSDYGSGAHYDPAIPFEVIMTPNEFKTWLNEETSLQFSDESIEDIEVPDTGESFKIDFNYTCKLTIEYGQEIKKSVDKDLEDKASFTRIPERIGYTSKPEAYSEIKNYGSGSNQSGTLKESWEAMAGVPSTEQLYFAAGGSEFIVDVAVEYTKDEQAKRVYDAYYTKTDCEFKNGDQAKTYTVPSPSGASSSDVTLQVHEGDLVVTATWTGQIPNKATAVTALHNATCPAQPDRTAYNTAKSQAQAWVSALNSHIISHTSVSDKQKRDYKLSASITTDSPKDPQTTSASVSCSYRPATKTSPGTPCGNEMATANPGGPGSYTITVKSTIPHHVICGPCCSHELPEIHDTWAQTFEYDSMRITDVHVWEIDQAAVNSLTELIGVDVVKAEIKPASSEPTIFYNIAMKNNNKYTEDTNSRDIRATTAEGKGTYTSEAGRVRYSIDPQMHDTVIYALGVRTNKCDGMAITNAASNIQAGGRGHGETWSTGIIYDAFKGTATRSGGSTSGQYVGKQSGNRTYPVNTVGFLKNKTDAKDKATTEYKEFLRLREQKITATMITDFLILQTSNGPQSVLYFNKTTATGSATAESEIPKMEITKEEMWDNNKNSASEWKEDHINVGGYNGKYVTPSSKFNVTNKGSDVVTIFDGGDSVKNTTNSTAKPSTKKAEFTVVRPNKPSQALKIYSEPLNIILENRNKSYETGEAEVFWQNLLHWTDVNSERFTKNPSGTVYDVDKTVGEITGFNFGANVNNNNDKNNTYRGTRALFGFGEKAGYILDAPYSKQHTKINDIIVHNPVSTENAMLLTLPDDRDQRTDSTGGAADILADMNKSDGCPGEPALCDFRHLIDNGNCDYFKDKVLLDMDFDTRDGSGNPINKITGNSIEIPSGYSIVNAPSGSGSSFTNLSNINMWRKSGSGTLTWDSVENAFKAVGHVQMYLKPEYAYKIDRNKTYTIKVTAKVSDYDNQRFYWGGDRLDSNRNHLQGFGGTYDYSAASAVSTGNMGWKTYTATKSGTAANASGWGTDTAYFAVGGLLNYQTKSSQVTWVKNIELYENGVLVQSMEPSVSGMSGKVLRTTASSPRMSIPFSELGITYSRSLKLKAEADIILDQATNSQMLFSFDRYDAYLINGYNGIVINTGNGAELHHQVNGINLRDNKKHHVAVIFSMTSTDNCEVYIDGIKATNITRTNTSRDVTTTIIGQNINIGSWGANSSYPLRGYVDNFRVVKLAGTADHNEDCYTLKMVHPNGLNKHIHDKDCLTSKDRLNFPGDTTNYLSSTANFYGGVANNQGVNQGSMTLMAWANPKKLDGSARYVISDGNNNEGYIAFRNNGITFYWGGSSEVTYSKTIDTNKWYHVAMEHVKISNTSFRLNAYVNGNLVGTKTVTSTNVEAHYGPEGKINVGYNFDGGIRDVRVYTGVLGSSVIKNAMNSPLSALPANLIAAWKMDNTSGSTVPDVKGRVPLTIKGTVGYVNGIEQFIQDFMDGKLTEQQLRDILGDAYEPIMANSFGPVIHTWSGWTSSNTYGFSPIPTSSAGNNYKVPVDFSASGVTKIEVTLNNPGSSTSANLRWTRGSSTTEYSLASTMKAKTNSQVVTFTVRGSANWKDTISSLKFNFGNNVVISNIKVYGPGSKTAGGGSGTGTVVFQSGTAGSHTYNAPAGKYKLEVWGAQGGGLAGTGYSPYTGSIYAIGGKGGYSKGEIEISSSQTIRIHVGGQGSGNTGGYNGGGSSARAGAGGGGGTDIRIGGNAYSNRVIVAGGGGGAQYGDGGYGGGTTGQSSPATINGSGSYNMWGTTAQGGGQTLSTGSGQYGIGGSGTAGSDGLNGGAGGGGYVGGEGCRSDVSRVDDRGGAGGSGYIGGVTSGIITAGNASMPNPSGGTMTGKTGNGYARITSTFTPIKITGAGGNGDIQEGQSKTFSYTGGVQTMTLAAGTYKLEVWGAQGGVSNNSYANRGLGAYATGEIILSTSKNVSIYVGESPSVLTNAVNNWSVINKGGWNGGGNGTGAFGGGGGATDIRIDGVGLNNRIIVGAGGGGPDKSYGSTDGGGLNSSSSGSGGSGQGFTGATQTSGGKSNSNNSSYNGGFGFGGSGYTGGSTSSADEGGGGGGWYGGAAGYGEAFGGGGGSSYVGGVTSGQTIAGNASMPNPSGGTMTGNTGHGYARITALYVEPEITISVEDVLAYWDLIPNTLPDGTDNPIWSCSREPNVHECDSSCHEVKILNCNEPHHKGLHYDPSSTICWEPCNDDAAHKKYKPEINTTDGKFNRGNFVNIDYPFEVYFPNIGDYNQGQSHGMGALTSTRGLGFTNGLDTTKWTKVKRIRFNINVLYKNQLYVAGQWITLSDYGTYDKNVRPNGIGGTSGSNRQYDERNWSNYGTDLFDDVNGNHLGQPGMQKFDGVRLGNNRNNIYQFYAVLANPEFRSSEVIIDVEATNSLYGNDNINYATNRLRSNSFTALHGGLNQFYMDVVGRIGNLTIQDTTDYRFSNFFKEPTSKEGDTTAETYFENRLNRTDGVQKVGNSLLMNKVGARVGLTQTLDAGEYRIDINGRTLGNGKLKVSGKSSWKNIGDYRDDGKGYIQFKKEGPSASANHQFEFSGPNVTLNPGTYKIRMDGEGFAPVKFKFTGNTGKSTETLMKNLSSEYSEHKDAGALVYYFTLDEKVDNVSITVVTDGEDDFIQKYQGFYFDRIAVDILDTNTTVNMVSDGYVRKIVEASNQSSYYLTVPSETPVTIEWVSESSREIQIDNITLTTLGDSSEGWIIDNIVSKVDKSVQNNYLSWFKDIRGLLVSQDTKWIDTYANLEWAQKAIKGDLPLSPHRNNIEILKDEPMLPGYDVLLDISTIGNYYKNGASMLQVVPFYYYYNVQTKEYYPLDVYMKVDSEYRPVNIYKNYDDEGHKKTDIENYVVNLDWLNEHQRRNYTAVEQYMTDYFRTALAEGGSARYPGDDDFGETAQVEPYKQLDAPGGMYYTLGNAQLMSITGKARTFIGGETTYGVLMNRGGNNTIKKDASNGRLYNDQGNVMDSDWWVAAQRWHFKIGLPSSAIFVKHDKNKSYDKDREITKKDIIEPKDEVVILCTANILVVGETYALEYTHPNEGDNGTITVKLKSGASYTHTLPVDIPPVISVYSSTKTTSYDITIEKTH